MTVLGWSTPMELRRGGLGLSHLIVDRCELRAVAVCGVKRFAGQVETEPWAGRVCARCFKHSKRLLAGKG